MKKTIKPSTIKLYLEVSGSTPAQAQRKLAKTLGAMVASFDASYKIGGPDLPRPLANIRETRMKIGKRFHAKLARIARERKEKVNDFINSCGIHASTVNQWVACGARPKEQTVETLFEGMAKKGVDKPKIEELRTIIKEAF